MKKHGDCEALQSWCGLKEHKGYTTCERSGVCSELYNAECLDVFRELVGLCKVYEEDHPNTDIFQITIWRNSIMDRAIRLRLKQGADDLIRASLPKMAPSERSSNG